MNKTLWFLLALLAACGESGKSDSQAIAHVNGQPISKERYQLLLDRADPQSLWPGYWIQTE